MTQFHIFATHEELSAAVASYVIKLSAAAIAERGRFTVALSGGSLPKLLAANLITMPFRDQIDWTAWHVFFVDERCVPLSDPDSNYREAKTHLFDQVTLPVSQIYPIDPTLNPTAMAEAYQEKLQTVFGATTWPQFDLILLGLGPDGHTASLFPGHALLHEQRQWIAAIFDSPKPPPQRITFTLPLINAARHVAFLATGASKAEVLTQIKAGNSHLPASLIQPTQGKVNWFVDVAAMGGE